MKKEELIKWIKESILDKNGNVHRSKLLNTIFYQQNKQYYDILFDMFKSQNIKECVYLILNNLKEIPKCKCGNNLNFKGSTKAGYPTYCSTKCNSLFTVEKRKEIWLNKYGTTHPNKVKEIKQKGTDTFIANRPDDYYEKIVEQRRLNIDENGLNSYDRMVINNLQTKRINGTIQSNPDIIEKSKQTNLERYGAITFTASQEGKEQVIQTSLKNFGVTNHMKTKKSRIYFRNINSINARNRYNQAKAEKGYKGLVYVFYSKELNKIKIGVTLNKDINSRYNGIKKVVKDLEILTYFESDNCYNDECKLHNKFKEYNIILDDNIPGKTEWFNVIIKESVLNEINKLKSIL